MQISDHTLSRRYARALFLSAAGAAEEDRVVASLGAAYRGLLDKMPVFKHPGIAAAEKKALLRRILGDGAPRRTVAFLELLIDKKRFGLLPHLAADLARLADERKGIVHATARSAAELAPEELAALKDRLEAFCGKKVAVEVKLDPELLAGAVVRMGDWVFDGSLQGRIKRLKAGLGT